MFVEAVVDGNSPLRLLLAYLFNFDLRTFLMMGIVMAAIRITTPVIN